MKKKVKFNLKKLNLVKWLKKKKLVAGLLLVVVLILAFSFKHLVVVGLVNGRPIFRSEYVKELEKQAGSQVIESLVSKKLILQEAKRQKVVISDEVIEQEIAKIEQVVKEQGQELEELLVIQGMTRKELVAEIRIQKTVEALVGGSVVVTNEEVDQYLEENKEFLPEGSESEEFRASVVEQLKQQKATEAIQVLIKSLQEKSKVVSFL